MSASGAPLPTAGSGRAPVRFCEQCGKRVGPAPTLLKVVPHDLPGNRVWALRSCPFCGVHACDTCWADAVGACPACGIAVGVAARLHLAPPKRRGNPRPAIAVVAGVLVVSTLVFIVGSPSRPAGGVLGEIAPPVEDTTPSPSTGPSPLHSATGGGTRSNGPPAAEPPASTASPGVPSATSPPPPTGVASGPETPSPATSTPSSTPARDAVVAVAARFRGWSDPASVTRGQVLAVVQNLTSDWVMLPTGASTYLIVDQAGSRTTSGAFAYAFPQRLPPGGRAYLVDVIDASFADLAILVKATVQPVYESSNPSEGELAVIDFSWTEVDGGGLAASGRVSNQGPAEVHDVVVAAVFLDAAGQPLAVIYDPQPFTLAPDESRAFRTSYPDTGPLKSADIAQVETIAAAYEP